MKYAMILPDGAADEPIAALGGKTPLAAAKKPNIDWIAANGRQGRVVTVPKGFSPGSDVATLSLFGYAPKTHYNGRAPFEAAAQGISAGDDELIFRCNFVTVAEGRMHDFTAGHISQKEADQLIADLNTRVGGPRCRFYSGVSYRNLLILGDARYLEVRCTPPHDIPDKPVAEHLPAGADAGRVQSIMDKAAAMLADHDVNRVRRDLGENPATNIWLWGHGRPVSLEAFEKRFGVRGAVIAAVDLIRGIALSSGMKLIDVPGATGYLDTDYAAKGRYAVKALEHFDLIVVHIEAPDEAGHQGDVPGKVRAIEQIDQHIVGPLLTALRAGGDWRILIAPDHPTPAEKRVHTSDPPPFCLAGTGITGVLSKPFTEENAKEADLQINPGHELMEFFLKA